MKMSVQKTLAFCFLSAVFKFWDQITLKKMFVQQENVV